MEKAEDFQGTIYPPFLDTKDNMSHTSKGACLSPLTTEKVKIFNFSSVSEINSTHGVCIRPCDLKKTYTIYDLCMVSFKVQKRKGFYGTSLNLISIFFFYIKKKGRHLTKQCKAKMCTFAKHTAVFFQGHCYKVESLLHHSGMHW